MFGAIIAKKNLAQDRYRWETLVRLLWEESRMDPQHITVQIKEGNIEVDPFILDFMAESTNNQNNLRMCGVTRRSFSILVTGSCHCAASKPEVWI